MYVFVMMPFMKTFDPIRRSIREAAGRAKAAKAECIWADEITRAGLITAQIMDGIRESVVCIADVTGHNPNVAWEIGYAQALGKPVITLAEKGSPLFFDLKDQRTIIYERNDLSRTLVQELTNWLERFHDSVAHPEDLVGTERHELTSLALIAKGVADTPYAFFDLFSLAQKHIFVAAQNHFFLTEDLTNQERLRANLYEFLKQDRTRRVDIMLCDIAKAYAVRTWSYVAGGGRAYEADLRLATQFFGTLISWARAAALGPDQLTIRQVAFVPFSITFVDPEDRGRAFLVLTPNAYQSGNRARPCFILSRERNPDAFDAYWSGYHNRFISDDARNSLLALKDDAPVQ